MEQLALPVVLDRWDRTHPVRLGDWLDSWRHVDGVRLLASRADVVVVPADAALDVDPVTKLVRLLLP